MFQFPAQSSCFDTDTRILLSIETCISAENGLCDGKRLQVVAMAGKRLGHHEFKEPSCPLRKTKLRTGQNTLKLLLHLFR